MSFGKTQIDQVQKYWDRRTCNIRHSPQPVGTKEYFDDRGLAQRNCALAGGPDHLNSIQDAPYEFHGLGVKHKPDRYPYRPCCAFSDVADLVCSLECYSQISSCHRIAARKSIGAAGETGVGKSSE